MKDMTNGRPMTLILRFFIPLLFGGLFQQFYSMVDSMIVGKFVGVNALAGVGSTGSLNFLILGFCIGVTTGFGIKVGQCFGSGDLRAMRKYVINSIYLGVAVSVILTPLTVLLCKDFLIWTNTPEEIFQEAYDYIVVILAGISTMIVYNLAAAILRAIGDSKTPLIALLVSSLLNIGLDLLFVVKFSMGTIGASLATVISQGISGVVCMIYIFWHYQELRVSREERPIELHRCVILLKVGLPMALQFSITAIGTLILQAAVNGLGAVYVAAAAAGVKINAFMTVAFENIGVTMATYSSQNVGAGKIDRIRQGLRASMIIQMIFAVGIFLVIWFGGRSIGLLFLDKSETEILDQMMVFLVINGATYPLVAYLLSVRNTVQGMGFGLLAMFAGVFEVVGRVLAVVVMTPLLGFAGASMANPMAWLLADIFLTWGYFRAIKQLNGHVGTQPAVSSAGHRMAS